MKAAVLAGLVLAAILVCIAGFVYHSKKEAWKKDTQVKVSLCLDRTYKQYMSRPTNGVIDTVTFRTMVYSNLTELNRACQVLTLPETFGASSARTFCVVDCQGVVFVGLRANGERILMSRQEFGDWAREAGGSRLDQGLQ